MTDINSVTIIGRVTADIKITYLNSGTAKGEFGIAVNRSVKKNEQWADETSFFNLTLWGKTAESLQQYLTKGQQVAISGHLQQQRWKDGNGNNQSKVVVVPDSVQLIGGKKDGGNAAQNQNNTMPSDNSFQEDIPF